MVYTYHRVTGCDVRFTEKVRLPWEGRDEDRLAELAREHPPIAKASPFWHLETRLGSPVATWENRVVAVLGAERENDPGLKGGRRE